MRPRHLVMEGFLAYRRRIEVDFSDADLFVLSGPTGAGKSSVIDGMTFALYGSIPRLGKGSVAPLISAQSDRARVSFSFTVGDETYTAARMLERQGAGASTKEARLQRGEEEVVLAGTADEVTAEVTNLLGLSYEHFVKAVVLPQGAFADFLTDRPKDRQALLGELLDMGLYEEVMQLANVRARLADGRAKTVVESLAKLEVATEAQLEGARARLEDLVGASRELPDRLEMLENLDAVCRKAREAHTAVVGSLDRLRAIQIPGDLETLGEDRKAAGEAMTIAQTRLSATLEERRGLQERAAALPALARLESLQEDQVKRGELADRLAALDLAALAAEVEAAATAHDQARIALDEARVAHAAQDLRHGLSMGDPCPVCGGVFGTVDESEREVHGSIESLREELNRVEERANHARGALKGAEGEAKQIDRQLVEVTARLEAAPSSEAIEEMIETARSLDEARLANEKAVEAAQEEVEAARLIVVGLEERDVGLGEALLAARDRVAAEEPPLPGKDPIESWHRFDEWLIGKMADRSGELASLERAREEADEALGAAVGEQRDWLEGLGIAFTDSPGTDLALAEAGQRAAIDEMEKTITHASELEDELALEQSRARVASALGNHLKSNNFEAWLLEEAMDVLIDGANGLLDDLSGGAYSLKMTRGQFEVIDHRNAELTRTTRSLSGGETFLVSLSLALSMADQLALITGVSSRLESVFLDEGFGSLDQESLDVVASVLDELVGRGRTVGIVTHVRELADRFPVRFEVTKGSETASIARLET
ncbi:MAG TPA: SMC family ATPase [Acidimicrobiia bacterium]|nr:SMC family ATPase [Acidimicrobiia bacterium]